MANQVFDTIRQIPPLYLLTGTLLVGFVVANAKSMPLAHTMRLAPSLYRLLRARSGSKRSKSISSLPPTSATATSHAARLNLFKHYTLQSRTNALDLDINIHKSNSTFFADADVNRAELITSLLSQALANLGSPAFILAGVQCKFHREIRPYQSYVVSSRILTWSDKAMYVVTYFVKPGTKLAKDLDLLGGPEALLKDGQMRKIIFATMVSKYVFKAGRATVAPEHVFQEAGLLLKNDDKDNDVSTGGDGFVGREDVTASVQVGLRYITLCMM
jgi:acyl-CoA thioesterase FadM